MYGYPGAIRLAENPRTQVGAKIKRASRKAQAEATKLVGRDIKQLEQLYRTAAADIQAEILAHQNADGVLGIETRAGLLDSIDRRLETLRAARDGALVNGMQANAEAAITPFAGSAAISANLSQVANNAVQFVQTLIAEDGLQLSDRLWRIDRGAREAVGEAVESAIIQGFSATRAAEEFAARGEAIPVATRNKTQATNASAMSKIPVRALVTNETSAYAQAERVFRTEINRAHIETYRNTAFEHPDVVGTKFTLSHRHPRPDICDMHASVNLYGLGPGVYPKGKSPLPAHPNTLSYEVVVFRDEVTDADRAGRANRIAWLKQQPTRTQISILGVHKAWMLKAGHLSQNQIRTPWRVLKKRLERQGIVAPPGLSAVPISDIPQRRTDTTVSSALQATAHKRTAKHALDVIDQVHDDGVLPVIEIKGIFSRTTHGAYVRTVVGDKAVRMELSRHGDHKELTLVHEVGHFIDHQGLPEVGMSSEFSRQLDAWRSAALASKEIKTLEKELRDAHSVRYGEYIGYTLRRREIWARSYAQWIATRSGDRKLMGQLNALRDGDRLPLQWTDESFEPIGKEIERLFRSLGWIKTQT